VRILVRGVPAADLVPVDQRADSGFSPPRPPSSSVKASSAAGSPAGRKPWTGPDPASPQARRSTPSSASVARPMRFWDTSAIVPLLMEQRASRACRSLRRANPAVAVWLLTRVEVTWAVFILVREGLLPRRRPGRSPARARHVRALHRGGRARRGARARGADPRAAPPDRRRRAPARRRAHAGLWRRPPRTRGSRRSCPPEVSPGRRARS
jgi:hypothetical protein